MVDTLAIALSFQPALPMRGVTDVNGTGAKPVYHVIISTRTPHAGSDGRTIDDVRAVVEFQPALPMRGVTIVTNDGYTGELISTRTPHAGSDPMRPIVSVTNSFQPALPMRGVTVIKMRLFKFV